MSDLISRGDTLKDIADTISLYGTGTRVESEILSVVSKIPSVESKWIPFSERMPDDWQVILLSGNKKVECAAWDDELKEWYRDFGEEVTAWMPFPEVYRGERDDKES